MNKIIISLLLAQHLYSVGVPAGTAIENEAFLNYKVGEQEFSLQSNKVIDIVDQKIDMKMICQESNPVTVGVGEVQRAMTFMLSNQGNGKDKYVFDYVNDASSDFEVENKSVFKDNGDGVFSATTDTELTNLELSADENVTLFLVSDIPATASNLSLNGIKVSSELYGALAYGESKKLKDFYAVMSVKEDALSDLCAYKVSNLALKVQKSATLSSDKAYKGSTIHYSLAVKVVGTGTISDVKVIDSIPTGTSYVANSLQLDGVNVGDFNGTAIVVNLGEIVQEEESVTPKHFITFDVKVN